MDQWLLERELFALAELKRRRFTLPDGEIVWVKMDDLTWRWFDRLEANEARYENFPFEPLIVIAVRLARERSEDVSDILARMVAYEVCCAEDVGLDLLEPDWQVELDAARRAEERWREKKKSGPASPPAEDSSES